LHSPGGSWLAAALVAGCSADLVLPREAQIECVEDGECPDGFICKTALGRCVQTEAIDQDPPEVDGAPRIAPDVGTIDTRFSVCFDVSEPLMLPPVVHLGAGAAGRVVARDEEAAEADGWCYAYVADGSEGSGSHALTVDLADQGGNSALGLALGALDFDFGVPRLATAPVFLTEVIAEESTAELTITFDEPLEGSPDVRMWAEDAEMTDVGLAWEESYAEEARTFHMVYTPSGDEPEGQYLVLLSAASDRAGNVSPEESIGALRLDFSPPVILDHTSIAPALAILGQTIIVDISTDEELGEDQPRLTGEAEGTPPLAFQGGVTGLRSMRFTHTVASNADTNYDLFLSGLVDVAGNELQRARIGSLGVDVEDPHAIDFWQSHDRLAATDTLEVRFSVSEPLAMPAEARLGQRDMRRVGEDDAPYTFTFDGADEHLDDQFQVNVELHDPAGHHVYYSAGAIIEVDTIPPRLVGVSITPELAGLDTGVLLLITTTEELAEPPIPIWGEASDPGFEFVLSSGLAHTFELTVDENMQGGTYLLTGVRMVDRHGNREEQVWGDGVALELDVSVPRISSVALDAETYSAQPGHEGLQVTFDTSESLDGDDATLAVTLRGEPVGCELYSGPGGDGLPPSYTCSRPITLADETGPALVRIRTEDAAGNMDVATTTFEIDHVPPTVEAVVSASPLALGDVLEVRLTPSEELGRIDLVAETATNQQLLFGPAVPFGRALVFRHEVREEDYDGALYTVSVDFEDAVRNPGADEPQVLAEGLRVDATPPVVAANLVQVLDAEPDDWVLLTDNWLDQHPLKDGAGLALRVLVGERFPAPPDEALELLIDGIPVGAVAPDEVYSQPDEFESLLGYRLSFTVAAASWGGRDGQREVALVARDLAGNPSEQIDVGRVRLDFRGPRALHAGLTLGSPLDESGFPLLQRVTRVTNGTRVELVLAFDEEVRREGLAVWLARMDGEQELGRVDLPVGANLPEHDGRTLSWPEITLPEDALGGGAALQGPWQLFVTATDLAGNTTTAQDATVQLDRPFDVDTLAPVAPAGDAEGLLYRRARWGSASPVVPNGEGEPEYIVSASAGTFSGPGDVLLWDLPPDADVPQRATERSSPIADDLGLERPIVLAPPDRPLLLLSVVDEAGNESSRVPIRNVEWVAAMGFKEVGDTGSNPHRWGECGALVDVLLPDDEDLLLEVAPRPVLFPGDGEVLTVTGERARRWVQRDPSGRTPDPRADHALAADPERSRLVLFGGAGYGDTLDDTWEWDGVAWTRFQAAPAPPARMSPALAWDPGSSAVLLFGGDQALDDTWHWSQGDWSDPAAAGSPPGRRWHALATDTNRSRVVLFGGWDEDDDRRNDTWEWVGGMWEDVTPARPPPLPTARAGHALAWDAARGNAVLFGGFDGVVRNDTWLWDGESWTSGGAGDAPPPRWRHTLAYDSARQRVVLFGGMQGVDHRFDDTWEWDGAAWTELHPSVSPPPISRTAAAYDAMRAQVVLFGGWDEDGFSNETWTLPSLHEERPAQRFDVDLGQAQVPPGTVLLSLTASFVAGGVGHRGAGPTTGAELLVWDPQGSTWRAEADNDAGVDVRDPPEPVVWSVDDGALVEPRVNRGQLSLAVAPVGRNGTGYAQIAVDHAEVVVRYLLPEVFSD